MFGIFERFFKRDKIKEIAEFLAVAIHLDGVDEPSEMKAAVNILREIDPDSLLIGLIEVKKHLMSYAKNHQNFLNSKERVFEYFEGHIGQEAGNIRALMLLITQADGDYSEKERLFIESIGG